MYCDVIECVAVSLGLGFEATTRATAPVTICVAVCCSVLQRVAVCCSVLQCVAVCCSVLQCVAVCCSVLQCVAVCCRVTQSVAVCLGITVLHTVCGEMCAIVMERTSVHLLASALTTRTRS